MIYTYTVQGGLGGPGLDRLSTLVTQKLCLRLCMGVGWWVTSDVQSYMYVRCPSLFGWLSMLDSLHAGGAVSLGLFGSSWGIPSAYMWQSWNLLYGVVNYFLLISMELGGVWCVTPLEDVIADMHFPLLSRAGFTGGWSSTLPAN